MNLQVGQMGQSRSGNWKFGARKTKYYGLWKMPLGYLLKIIEGSIGNGELQQV